MYKNEKNLIARAIRPVLCTALVSLLMACGAKDEDGTLVQEEVPLPVDQSLELYCEDAGIFEDPCIFELSGSELLYGPAHGRLCQFAT